LAWPRSQHCSVVTVGHLPTYFASPPRVGDSCAVCFADADSQTQSQTQSQPQTQTQCQAQTQTATATEIEA